MARGGELLLPPLEQIPGCASSSSTPRTRASASRSTSATRSSAGCARGCGLLDQPCRHEVGHSLPGRSRPSHLRLVRRADQLRHRRRLPGRPDAFDEWWPADVHVIGKNITRFHCLYWPAMLMSAGLPLPRQVFAHGFMLDPRREDEQDAGQLDRPRGRRRCSASTASATWCCARSRSTATRTHPPTDWCGAITPTSPTTSATSSTARSA